MNIKTWQEALGHDRPLLACGAVGEAMQAEIDELRAALAERDAEIVGWRADQKENLANQCNLQAIINAQRDVLRQALTTINANHHWHTEYDDFDGYGTKSQLHTQNIAAITAIQGVLR